MFIQVGGRETEKESECEGGTQLQGAKRCYAEAMARSLMLL